MLAEPAGDSVNELASEKRARRDVGVDSEQFPRSQCHLIDVVNQARGADLSMRRDLLVI
jgi:hypothetical protein